MRHLVLAILMVLTLPSTAAGLHDWLADHPAVDVSPGMEEAVEFLRSPPLPAVIKASYRVLFAAAAALLALGGGAVVLRRRTVES